MQLVVIDKFPDTRSAVMGRVHEALRQSGIRRVHVLELEVERVREFNWANCLGCFIGPGCYDILDHLTGQIRGGYEGPVGAVLENAIYAGEAVGLKRRLNIEVMPLSDLAQIASFLLACDKQASATGGNRNRGVIGVCQLKGGVGTTTLAAALASCWARHDLSVAAVDLDDVAPQLTAWGRCASAQRGVVAECLRAGKVPAQRINELVTPIEGYDGRLVVVGQPEHYNEGFHFKANVIDNAPSASEFIFALIENLILEFDIVVIDMGRSWGVSTFAALPLCQYVLLACDDDGMSVRCSLDQLMRLKQESDDPDEFDFKRWSVVLNAYTGRLLSAKDVAQEIQATNLFPTDATLFAVPFSDSGRQWGGPGRSFYDAADAATQEVIRSVAHTLIPFSYERAEKLHEKLKRRLQNLVGAP